MRDIEILGQYMPVLLSGVVVTVQLSSLALFFGSLVGLVVGLMRSSPRPVLRLPATIYIEVLRSIPVLLLLFFIYYALPLVMRVDIPSYPAAVAGLSLFCSAFMAEVVRTGVESVHKGQWEAAYSLGMRFPAVFRYVILPQALRVAIPPAISIYSSTIKDSSLASVIGFVELTGAGVAIREAQFGQGSFTVILAVAAGYFVMVYSLSLLGQHLERRVRI